MSATSDVVIDRLNAEMEQPARVLEVITDHDELLKIRSEISDLEYDISKVEGKYQKKAEQENFERSLKIAALRRKYENGIRACVETGNLESPDIVIREKPGTASRTIQREKFIESFPDVFKQIAEIPLGKADSLLGRVTVDAYCDHNRKPSTWVLKTRMEESLEASTKRKRMGVL